MKRFIAPPLLILVFALVAVSCQSLYTGAVTLTKTVEAAARDYAVIYKQGLVPPDVHVKVSNAHIEYRKAAGVAADALEAYKAGKTVDTKAALEAARVAANNFVDLLVGLLPKQRITQVRSMIKEARQP